MQSTAKFRDWEKNPSFLIPVSASVLIFGRVVGATAQCDKKRSENVW